MGQRREEPLPSEQQGDGGAPSGAADRGVGSRFGLLHQFVGYGVTRSASEGLLGLRGVALASLLGPELFGVWSLFRMALGYLGFVAQGLLRGMEVKVAATSSRHHRSTTRGQKIWGQVVLGPTLFLYGSLSVAAVVAWLWPTEGTAGLVLLGVALGLLPDRLLKYARTFLRASGSLRQFAVLELLQTALQLVFTVGLALVWGLVGAFAGFLAANVTGLCFAAHHAPWRPRYAPRRAGQVFRIGFPVSLINISTTVLQTVDRLLVGAFAGIAALGIYSFAVTLSGLGVGLAQVVRNVVLTHVYGRKSASVAPHSGRMILDRSMAAYTTLLPPLAGLAALILGPVVMIVLPQYEPAILPAQIFVFIGVLQGIVNVSVLGIVADGRQGRLPFICLGAVFLNVILSLLALFLGLGLEGVAAGTLFSRAVYAVAAVSLLSAGGPKRATYRALVKSLTPSLWCAAAVIAIHLSVPVWNLNTLTIGLISYSLSMIPLAIFFRSTLAGLNVMRSEI
jgi:O-antigen/teichoic acid export membrane protein